MREDSGEVRGGSDKVAADTLRLDRKPQIRMFTKPKTATASLELCNLILPLTIVGAQQVEYWILESDSLPPSNPTLPLTLGLHWPMALLYTQSSGH